MSKGSSTPSTTTVNQTDLPEYVQPYFTRLLNRTEAQSNSTYTPYTGQRIAPLGADIGAAHDLTRDIAGSGIAGLPEAMGTISSGMAAGQGIAAGQNPYAFSAPQMQTDAGVMGSYMSPYMQNVLDVQKRQAREQFDIQRAGRNAQAVQAGAFGGSRQAVAESLAEDDLLNRMANIDATGMQNAYQNAQQAFQADRAQRFATEQAQAGENRASTGIQLSALGFAGQQAGQLAGLGEVGRAADIQNAQLLEAIGKQQQAQQQQMYDLGYEDFLRQQAWPEQQLQFYSSILRGVPVEPSVTQTTYQPYNPLQQALGAGLGAIGLYRGLTA